MRYQLVPTHWRPDDHNPLTPDGSYPLGTTAVVVAEDASRFMGSSKSGLFHYRLPRSTPHLQAVLADLVRYEESQGRSLLVSCPDEADPATWVERALAATPPSGVIRPWDPLYLVHATTLECGRQILRDGTVRSLACLVAEGRNPPQQELLSAVLGEPPEYADYVNLGPWESLFVDTVVASHALGRFVSPDDKYTPGMRFYFDSHQIIRAGLAVRIADGIKVHRELPLEPFCLLSVGVRDVDPESARATWTPRTFTEEANRLFLRTAADASG